MARKSITRECACVYYNCTITFESPAGRMREKHIYILRENQSWRQGRTTVIPVYSSSCPRSTLGLISGGLPGNSERAPAGVGSLRNAYLSLELLYISTLVKRILYDVYVSTHWQSRIHKYLLRRE